MVQGKKQSTKKSNKSSILVKGEDSHLMERDSFVEGNIYWQWHSEGTQDLLTQCPTPSCQHCHASWKNKHSITVRAVTWGTATHGRLLIKTNQARHGHSTIGAKSCNHDKVNNVDCCHIAALWLPGSEFTLGTVFLPVYSNTMEMRKYVLV